MEKNSEYHASGQGKNYPRPKSIQEHWQETLNLIEERKNRGKPEFPTGLKFIDDATDGLHRGEIWVIAGKSYSGKTTLALQIAKNFADNPDHSIAFLSLEMKGRELMARYFCSIHNVDYQQFISGCATENILNKIPSFWDYLINIDFEIFEYGYNWQEVEHILQSSYNKKPPDVLFIDFLQYIDKTDSRDERTALNDYLRRAKELTKKLNVGLVIVSQLRRLPSGADYNRPPEMTDMMGTGFIEQSADKVVLIYSKHTTNEDTGEVIKKKYFINLAKNRQGLTAHKQVWFGNGNYQFTEEPPRIEATALPGEAQEIANDFNGTFQYKD